MKIIMMLAMFMSFNSFAQTSGQVDLNAAVFKNDNVGVLSFDVLVDQNLRDVDDRELERIKISVLETVFGSGNVEMTTSFISLKRDAERISPTEKYTVNQLQLISGKIVSVVPMDKGFKLTISAHAGIGFTVKGILNDTNNQMITDAEYKLFEYARKCEECIKEAVKQAGYFPIEAGLKVQLNKDNSYISFSGDYQKSGKLNTIPGEDRLPISTDRYQIHVAENKTVVPLSLEVGHELKSAPITLYARGEQINYRSSVDSSYRNQTLNLDERNLSNYTFKVGVRIKLGGIFR